VAIEIRLQADALEQFGGWNIDEFSVFDVEAGTTCAPPTNYCLTSPNTISAGAVMGYIGSTNVSENDFWVTAIGCPLNGVGLFYYGPDQTLSRFGNGYRCVSGTRFRFPIIHANGYGVAAQLIDLSDAPGGPIHGGETWNFQFWYRNLAAGAAGFNLSDGLHVVFCP
jgi:hypothetical protein